MIIINNTSFFSLSDNCNLEVQNSMSKSTIDIQVASGQYKLFKNALNEMKYISGKDCSEYATELLKYANRGELTSLFLVSKVNVIAPFRYLNTFSGIKEEYYYHTFVRDKEYFIDPTNTTQILYTRDELLAQVESFEDIQYVVFIEEDITAFILQNISTVFRDRQDCLEKVSHRYRSCKLAIVEYPLI